MALSALRTEPLITKSADDGLDDPAVTFVTKSLEGFTTTYDDRLKAIEAKANDNSLSSRVDKLEAKLSRPNLITKAADAIDLAMKAFNGFIRGGIERVDPLEVKALTVATDVAGGYLVPDLLASEILKNLVQFSPIRSISTPIGVSVPEITYPVQTGATNATWVAEGDDRTASEPSFGQLKVGVYELATFTDVSVQLLEDSAFNIEAFLAADLGEQFGKIESTAFVAGDGVGKPKGFLTEATIAKVPVGHASLLNSDGLIDLFHALPGAYAANAVWGMNRTTIAAVRKLKAVDGSYLWTDTLSAGNPGMILGRPVVEIPDMPNVAANATPIVFGDFGAGYRIFDRVALSLLRDPYSQATKGRVRFHARRRVGGATVKAEALKLLKVATA